MNTLLLILSHLGSDSAHLYNTLTSNRRILGITMGGVYNHPSILQNIQNIPHKHRTSAAIYMDHLLYNFSLCDKNLYKFCKFIYVVREAHPSLSQINIMYPQRSASLYYTFRLRRICEVAKQTPGAVWLTWEDLASGKGLPLIEEYLGLKEKIPKLELPSPPSGLIPDEIVEKAQKSYEFYNYVSKRFDLRRV